MNKSQLKKMQDLLAKYFDPALGKYDMDESRSDHEDKSDDSPALYSTFA